MTAADRKKVQRSLAGALAQIDQLWSPRAFAEFHERHGEKAPERLRELLVGGIADEVGLKVEEFESLTDAVRMTA